MNTAQQAIPPDPGVHLPLPASQYKRFVAVFHVVFVAGLLCSLAIRWRRTGLSWTWLDALLVTLVAAQIALYVFFLVSPPAGRVSLGRWSIYFGGAFGLWLAEWRIEPAFEWAIGALLGQMFGVLPPRASLPASAVIFAGYFCLKFGWNRIAALSPWEWAIGFGMVGAWTALGLFLHKLVVTGSERARLIQELEMARRQLELARQRDAELAALRERERLARDLHDSLGHNLVTLSVQLEVIQRLCSAEPARAASLIEEMKRLTRTSMEQLRRSLAGLRAPGLADRSLAQAVRQVCDEVAHRSGLKVECQMDGGADALPPAVAEVLWRAAHEGLANIERHALAHVARVTLDLNADGDKFAPRSPGIPARHAVLRVTDDGVGLPPGAEAIPGHYGLRGLRERVEGIGGTFALAPGEPRGTVLEVRVPLPSL